MMEPMFFDCLTDAQCWSLFDVGVLQGHMLPVEVYERLARLAPEHGCCLFTWPAGVALPSLHDMLPGVATPGDAPSAQTDAHGLETRLTVEEIRLAIEAFCARVHSHRPLEGKRIYAMVMSPRLELRAGPYLESQPRDLSAMSVSELEAYLDDLLRLGEGDAEAAYFSLDTGPGLG
jgi:hypothetical protein